MPGSSYNLPLDLDPREGYGEITVEYDQVLDLSREGEGSSSTNTGTSIPHGGDTGGSSGGSSGGDIGVPGSSGGGTRTLDAVSYDSGGFNLPSSQEFSQLATSGFSNDIYENLAASPTQTYHNSQVANLTAIFSGIRIINPLSIEIDRDPTSVIVGVSGNDLPHNPGGGGSGGPGGGPGGTDNPTGSGPIPNTGGVVVESGVDVGGPPINGGSGPGLNLFLPPSRTIAGVNLPFRINHRSRGARESTKFILLGQKLFYIILALTETLKVGQRKVDDNFDSIYPTDAQIAQVQHCLIQVKFFEELRTRKATNRWFN